MAKRKLIRTVHHPSTSQAVTAPFKPALARPPRPASAPQLRLGLWLPILAGLVFVAFSFGFRNDFVDWDDPEYVVDNPLIRHPTWETLKTLLRTPVALNYHPLTLLSLAANAALFDPGPTSFIVTNTLIHVLNTLLIFGLTDQLSRKYRWVSLFVALLWGLHPVHVESVIWVSERKDVLYTFFFLLACLNYLRYRQSVDSGARQRGWLGVTFGLFVLACLAKAMAVVLPVVLLLIDYWLARPTDQRRPFNRALLLEKVPFFVVSLFVGWVAANVQAGGDFYGWLTILGQKKDAVGDDPFAGQWLVYGSYGFFLHLVKVVFPFKLSAFYPYPDKINQPETYQWMGPIVFLAVAGLTGWLFLKGRTEKDRLIAFGLGFFLATIVLVLQFMTVGAAMLADRYSYLSYFGLLFGLVYGLHLMTQNRPFQHGLATLGLGLFAALCFYRTTQQVRVWKNTETLWFNALQYYPENDQIRESLGDYYGKQNRIDEAIAQFKAAIANGTNRYHCYEGLGNAYGLKGDYAQALEMYNQATRMDSTQGDVFYNRGLTLNKINRNEAAIQDFTKALHLMPYKDSVVLAARGYAYLQAKQYRKSLADYERYLTLKPNDPTALHNRGVDHFYLGDTQQALADIRRAIALKPDYEEAKNNLRQLEKVQ